MEELLNRIRKEITHHSMTVHPPLNREQLRSAEETIGYPLPELLRQIYLTIGNGGFGPGKGLLPLTGDAFPETIVRLIRSDEASDQRGILEEYLPLFHWEGNSYGYYHAIEDDHVLLLDDDYLQDEFDRNRPIADQYPVVAASVKQLLQDWLDGEPLTAESYRTLAK